MLKEFGTGWSNLFENAIKYAITSLPDVTLTNIERYKAMLRVTFTTSNKDLQYILDCLSYKIERESARTCETCGSYGFRRFSEWLSEPLCLCTPCYVKHVDDSISKQK